LAALRRRKWIVLQALVIVPAIAIGLAMTQASVYRASADVLLNRTDLGATVLGVPDPAGYQDPLRYSETQAALARVPEVAARAARRANIPGITWDVVRDNSVVRPSLDSDVIRFSVSSGNPQIAVALATAYAQAFIEYSSELNTASLGQARRDLRQRLNQLRAAGENRTTLYANLSDKEQQLRTLELLQSRHKLIRPASTAAKIAPRPMKNAVLAFAGGILLALGLALVLEMLDKRVRSEDEISRRLRLPLLARIPDPPRRLRDKKQLVMLVEPSSLHAEPVRRLRTNLEFVNAETQARTILVTSAVAGEGKSTTAGNLAVAAARSGQHVALVDLDLRRPTLHDIFRVPQAPGATDVALGRVNLEDVVRRIPLQDGRTIASTNGRSGVAGRLEFLSVGTLPPNPGEFLGTQGIAEVLSALSQRADLVLVDAPPLLAVGDTLPLTARVDAIVVVTRYGLVSRPMLADLARELSTLPTAKLGFVITGAGAEETYGYGYGYGEDQHAPSEPGGRIVELERPQPTTAQPRRWS
jgi:succinoglycan biosynthesis transport protein ExoP